MTVLRHCVTVNVIMRPSLRRDQNAVVTFHLFPMQSCFVPYNRSVIILVVITSVDTVTVLVHASKIYLHVQTKKLISKHASIAVPSTNR